MAGCTDQQQRSRRRRGPHGERGTGAVELVGVTAAVALLLASVGSALATHGDGLGRLVAARLETPIRGSAGAPAAPMAAMTVHRPPQLAEAGPAGAQLAGARLAGVQSPRVSVNHHAEQAAVHGFGELQLRDDDLRLRPIVSTRAARHGERSWKRGDGVVRQRAELHWCAACAGAGWRGHGFAGGGAQRGIKAHEGIGGELFVHAFAALAAVDATWAVAARGRLGSATLQLRGAATIGGDAEGHGVLLLGRTHQELHASGTLMAGATARAEQRASLRFAGIALRETAGLEGWAGAGVTGTLHAKHTGPGQYEFKLRGGGATGLGGAADISASIDAQQLLQRTDLRGGDRALGFLAAVMPGPASPTLAATQHVRRQLRLHRRRNR